MNQIVTVAIVLWKGVTPVVTERFKKNTMNRYFF